jgi:hypothetical protein
VDAHILIAFIAYCLAVTLRHRLRMHAPGLTPRAVLEKLAGIQMLDVSCRNNRLRASRRLPRPCPVLNSKCSEDFGGTFVENKALSRIRCAELRRLRSDGRDRISPANA